MRAIRWAALACLISLRVQASSVIDLTDASFDTHTATGNGNWMLDIYAPWCSHCQTLAPIWEELADELHGKVNVGKINGEENEGLMARFQVQGFPTIFHLNGETGEVRRYDGPRSVEALQRFASGGWGEVEPLPFWDSPTSGWGRLVGLLHRCWDCMVLPSTIGQWISFWHHQKGYSQLSILAGLLVLPLIAGLTLICALDYRAQATADQIHYHHQ